jgi:hypothetical protein
MGMLDGSFILSRDVKKDGMSRQAARRENIPPTHKDIYYKFVFSLFEYNKNVALVFFPFYLMILFIIQHISALDRQMPLAYPLLYPLADPSRIFLKTLTEVTDK